MKSISAFQWESFAIGAVLSVIAQVHSEDNSSTTPVAVRRRPALDIYTVLQVNKTEVVRCHSGDDNATYLVEEKQCINNRYLFNGKEKCITTYNILIDGKLPMISLNMYRMLFCNKSKWRIQHITITSEYYRDDRQSNNCTNSYNEYKQYSRCCGYFERHIREHTIE
jgi:hypothetical protein